MASDRNGRTRNRAGRAVLWAVVALLLAAGLVGSRPVSTLRASPLGAPAADAIATDYLPTAADVPGGFREQTTIDNGGLLEPGSSMRRMFASLDGARTLSVEVTIGQSPTDAQNRLNARVNQLVRYQGGTVGGLDGLGDRAFRATTVSGDYQVNQMVLFRLNAISSEVSLSAPAEDSALVDSVARFVEARMHDEADAVTFIPGFAPTPQSFPGKEPPGPPLPGSFGTGTIVGNTADQTGVNDTVVQLTLLALDRPWIGTIGPRPPVGFNYLTVQVSIETQGPTPANVLLEDFSATTLDGRQWPPIVAREPSLRATQVVAGLPDVGWLTFALPADQPGIQVVWRLRSAQTIGAQGGGDQTLTIPFTVGASANASIGSPAPPASVPVQPPSAIPPGSAPINPTSPGGSGPGGGGSGGGGSSSGPRLQ